MYIMIEMSRNCYFDKKYNKVLEMINNNKSDVEIYVL